MPHPLQDLITRRRGGAATGIASICSAHPLVIETALRAAVGGTGPVLIEATCNQVNQEGGYTGMKPANFRRFVETIADAAGFDRARLILGGDHLGPNPWTSLPAQEAMGRAEAMVAAYAAAGFTKLHLDTSMGCAGEPAALGDAVTAERAARLAAVAEAHAPGERPVYVIGTEVPVPGGATAATDHLQITDPAAVRETHAVHARAFAAAGQEAAFARVIAMVVQPGVEFGDAEVVAYDRGKARALSAALDDMPGLVFEAHSTDYQSPEALRALVEDGFAILKVGPWLTFALREGLYALDAAADLAAGEAPRHRLMTAMETAMQARPEHWKKYYEGDEGALWRKRHFSLSDRIRYYWPDPRAAAAVADLEARSEGRALPRPAARQAMPGLPGAGFAGTVTLGREVPAAHVRAVLEVYAAATGAA